jgi:acyl-CoA synthetase (AMP-forming)/AMP-acid ligase II
VLIVDSDTGRPVEPGQVGEIWVGGPSLPAGYWENPEASEKTFRARPSGGPAEPFMRTGDLGFVHEGELYVTGRLKDVVIVGGRNHYPQDLEETAENAHPSVRKGCVAAFTIEDHDTERVVLVVGVGQDVAGAAAGEEAVRKRAEIARAVRTAVTAEHGIPVHDVVVVGRSGVPKTSSGKLQRSVSRAAYLNGEYAYPDNTE